MAIKCDIVDDVNVNLVENVTNLIVSVHTFKAVKNDKLIKFGFR